MDGEIDAEELQTLLDAGENVRIVDIRSPGAFARGHIPESVIVPFAELTARIEELANEDRIVTVCPHGQASVQAARLIASYEKFSGRVDSLEPGIEGWPYELAAGDGSADAADVDAPF